ncbi:MAG: DnaA N-terminal domain-containing protein [Bryobacteraceae bacterium]
MWWQATVDAPMGDIGRKSNREIVDAMDWDGDADDLILALVECGWLDVHDEYRLVVHDWEDHAPTYLKASIKSRSLRLSEQLPRTLRDGAGRFTRPQGTVHSGPSTGDGKKNTVHKGPSTRDGASILVKSILFQSGGDGPEEEPGSGAARRGEMEGPDDAAKDEAGRWPEVMQILQTMIDEESWRTWFDPECVRCVGLSAAGVWLEAAGNFYCNWLANNYAGEIARAAREAFGLDDDPEVYIRGVGEAETAQDDDHEPATVLPEP